MRTSDCFVPLLVSALFASLLSPGCRGPVDRSSALETLVEAERAFSALSNERGVRSSFLTYLADDAIVFRPGPVNGREWYQGRTESGGVLTWEPEVADVSVGGDLGYTTGPWRFVELNAGAESAVFGEYVSVWRRVSGGVWRVAIDVGVVHRGRGRPERLLFRTRNDKAASRAEGVQVAGMGRDELVRAASEFSSALIDRGTDEAYERFAADDIRVLRTDVLPANGKREARDRVRGDGRVVRIETSGAEVSASGDLGYVYGVGEWQTGSDTGRRAASYLWVWELAPGGTWKMMLDIQSPHPASREGEGQ